jgi:hypothetical protein
MHRLLAWLSSLLLTPVLEGEPMLRKQRVLVSSVVVKSTPLPSAIKVDIISRGFQFGLLLLAGWTLLLCAKQPSQTPVIIWVLAGLFLAFSVYLQFHSSGLALEEGGFRYTSMFIRTRHLSWPALASVSTGAANFDETGAAIQGLDRVDVSTAPYLMLFQFNDDQPPLLLNIKPYRMAGLQTLVHFILDQAPQAAVDKTTREIIQGVVPPPHNPYKALPKG